MKSEPVIIVQNLGKYFKRNEFTGGFALQNYLEFHVRNSMANLKGVHSSHQNKTLYFHKENKFWALKNVSFKINKGETVGLIGHNGAGKSVLLKILSQITKPSEGTAEIIGKCNSMLEVDTGFHWELSGRENIFMSGAILGLKKQYIEEKFDEILELSGIASFIDMPIKRYSSGMRVRLGFALATQLKPEILILDEILAVGDEVFRVQCVEYLQKMKKNGHTILIVSHNLNTIQKLCDRVLWFEKGRLKLEGPTYKILNMYLKK